MPRHSLNAAQVRRQAAVALLTTTWLHREFYAQFVACLLERMASSVEVLGLDEQLGRKLRRVASSLQKPRVGPQRAGWQTLQELEVRLQGGSAQAATENLQLALAGLQQDAEHRDTPRGTSRLEDALKHEALLALAAFPDTDPVTGQEGCLAAALPTERAGGLVTMAMNALLDPGQARTTSRTSRCVRSIERANSQSLGALYYQEAAEADGLLRTADFAARLVEAAQAMETTPDSDYYLTGSPDDRVRVPGLRADPRKVYDLTETRDRDAGAQ